MMPHPLLRHILLPVLFALSFPVQAEFSLNPGIYVREGGSGTLTLKEDAQGNRTFSLNAIGVNAHTCELEEQIRDGKALMKDDPDGRTCTVTFTPKENGVDVLGRDEESANETGACRYYCGMRASFGGFYLVPPPGCAPPEIRQAWQDFQRFYDRKAYKKALATLKPVFDNCQSVLHTLYDEGRIRNDLAITYYKRDDYRACHAILKPYAEDAVLKEEDIEAYAHAPGERDVYLSIISAARVNLRLCEQAEKAAWRKKKHQPSVIR